MPRFSWIDSRRTAVIAQLGERETEDLEVPGSIPGHGIFFLQSLAKAHISLCILSLRRGNKKLAESGVDPPTFEL